MRSRSLAEFLADTGLAERTLRHWHANGVVQQVTPADGGYTAAHVLRVRGVFALRAQGVRRLEELARRLDAMSEDELRRLVGEPALASPGPAAAATLPAQGPTDGSTGRPPAALVEEHVEITLRPGLVLRVRRPVDDETRTLVRAIASFCGTSADVG